MEEQVILRLPPKLAAEMTSYLEKSMGNKISDNQANANHRNKGRGDGDSDDDMDEDNAAATSSTKARPRMTPNQSPSISINYYQDEEAVAQGHPPDTYYIFEFGSDKYYATMIKLPCIIESQKTVDNEVLFKTADVSYMLKVHDEKVTSGSTRAYDATESESGITPPMQNVVSRRFNKVSFQARCKKHNLDEKDIKKDMERADLELYDMQNRAKKAGIFDNSKKAGNTNNSLIYEELVDQHPFMQYWDDDLAKFNLKNGTFDDDVRDNLYNVYKKALKDDKSSALSSSDAGQRKTMIIEEPRVTKPMPQPAFTSAPVSSTGTHAPPPSIQRPLTSSPLYPTASTTPAANANTNQNPAANPPSLHPLSAYGVQSSTFQPYPSNVSRPHTEPTPPPPASERHTPLLPAPRASSPATSMANVSDRAVDYLMSSSFTTTTPTYVPTPAASIHVPTAPIPSPIPTPSPPAPSPTLTQATSEQFQQPSPSATPSFSQSSDTTPAPPSIQEASSAAASSSAAQPIATSAGGDSGSQSKSEVEKLQQEISKIEQDIAKEKIAPKRKILENKLETAKKKLEALLKEQSS